MRILEFDKLIRSETAASRYLVRRRWGGRDKRCLNCNAKQLYRLGEGRYRCARCGYTFGDLTGTWLAQSRISAVKWLWLIKLFELEITAWQAAAQMGTSYPTVLRAYTIIRRAVLAQEQPELVREEVEADESYFGGRQKGRRGRGAAGKIPVFGILERKGKVQVTVVPNVKARTLLDETVRLVKRGSLVYTDKWHSYDALTFYGYRHLRVDHARRFSRGRVHINGLEGFWSYAKGKLLKHHGVSPHRFPLYLYEMQFRYNHRRENLFDHFLTAVLKPVPDAL
jgi:transposase